MADFKQIIENLYVSGQIQASDLQSAHDLGCKTIIMNRPEGEEKGQPESDSLKAAAADLGMTWHDIPVVGGQISLDSAEAMGKAIADSQGKTLAFCRTGTRSCILWGLSEAMMGSTDIAAILTHAQKAGYDLSQFENTLTDIRNGLQG